MYRAVDPTTNTETAPRSIMVAPGSRHGHITRVKLVRSVYPRFEVVTLATGS